MRDQLLDMLRRYSYRQGTFTLASGRESDFYIDCKQTFLQRAGLQLAARRLRETIMEFPGGSIRAVAGEGVGGVPLAMAVSMQTAFPTFDRITIWHPVIIRNTVKDHTREKVEKCREFVPDGSRVVLIEDVLTTGGSALRAVQALREDRLIVVGVMALVDRLEGAHEAAREAGVEMRALYTRLDFIKEGTKWGQHSLC